jgi:hypothetical protein
MPIRPFRYRERRIGLQTIAPDLAKVGRALEVE